MEILLIESAGEMHPLDVLVWLMILITPTFLQVIVARGMMRRRDLEPISFLSAVPVVLGVNILLSWCLIAQVISLTGGFEDIGGPVDGLITGLAWLGTGLVVFVAPIAGIVIMATKDADAEAEQQDRIHDLRAMADELEGREYSENESDYDDPDESDDGYDDGGDDWEEE